MFTVLWLHVVLPASSLLKHSDPSEQPYGVYLEAARDSPQAC